jgi:hypothetical protein
VALFLTSVPSLAQDDIATLIDRARSGFKPVTENDLTDARNALKAKIQAVESFIRPSTANGRQWRRYLRLDELKKSVDDPQAANLQALDTSLTRLNRNEKGLENYRFRRLANALRRYRNSLAVSGWKDKSQSIYGSNLDALARAREAYRQNPSDKTRSDLITLLRRVDDIGQAPELVRAMNREFVKPNAFVEVSTAVIAAGAEPIRRNEPITDCILGTSIRSDASTTGTVGVATIPADDKAIVEFESRGHTWSRNVGFKSPAVIHSTADTNFTATKRVELTDPVFRMLPSRARAYTDTHIHSVAKQGGGLGSRLVSRIGMNRARQSERQAEAIAADHSEDRVERRFNEEVNDKVRDARERYEKEYRRPLIRRGDLPEHIRFSTDSDSVNLEVAQAGRMQLGASEADLAARPELPGKRDLAARVHESAVNNYAASFLAGATGSQTKADGDLEFDVTLPDWLKQGLEDRGKEAKKQSASSDAPFEPYSLTFAKDQPINVRFNDNKVTVILRVAELRSGSKTFKEWAIVGVYDHERRDDGGIVLKRGPLELFPWNRVFQQVPSDKVAERANLNEELNKRAAQGRGIPETIEIDPLEPEDGFANSGPLVSKEFTPASGWLLGTWNRSEKLPAPVRKTARR